MDWNHQLDDQNETASMLDDVSFVSFGGMTPQDN